MNVQLRVRLPALEGLRADSAVDWAQLHKGEVLAHGRDTLAALGLRHPQGCGACLPRSERPDPAGTAAATVVRAPPAVGAAG
jgi:hypothetical protein